MKTKKAIALFLAILLLVTLAACGSGSSGEKLSEALADKDQQTGKETKENTPPATDKPTDPPMVFDEITAIDNDACLVKITGIEKDSLWGYTLKVYLENKSSDKTYMYSIVDGAVNGVAWDPFFATEVAAGKKKNDEITFSDSDKEALLPEFTDIELTIRVYDRDDWTADDAARETIHIYPLGEDKATVYTRQAQPTDTLIVDNDQISIVVTDYDPNGFWGYTANVLLVNKTDAALSFSCDDVSVNGFMCDPFWATSVAPGKMKFSSISWSESSFEDNGITAVEEIEMVLRVRDSENWSAEYIYEETITLHP